MSAGPDQPVSNGGEELPSKKVSAIVKDWKKYLFEFLLIFTAVFLGFLADSFRENYGERQQAIALARSFYEELKNDSITIASKIEGRHQKENSIKYMIEFFRDSSLTSQSKELPYHFIWGVTARSPIIFTPRTVVLEQLKSSGSLRYFKNDRLQKLIGDLSVSIDYILARQEYENSIFASYMEPIMINHMDFDFQHKLWQNSVNIFDRLEEYHTSDEYIPFTISQPDQINRQALMNALGYYHTNGLLSTRLIAFQKYAVVNGALLKELRAEYGLK
ncbi:MAG: hypothetical protein ACK5RG_12820 [Cyclobacteriaceae bacterium]|jgi:hypothetical protein|nr:hypothetical protein [Flammeovirgaceae bacterium]